MTLRLAAAEVSKVITNYSQEVGWNLLVTRCTHFSPILPGFLQFEGNLRDISADVDLSGQRNLDKLLCLNTKEISHDVDDIVVFVSEDCIVVVITISGVNLKQKMPICLR